MKRTFLAIRIPANNCIDDCYNHFTKELSGEHVIWVSADHFHMTLYFLGDTSEMMIPSITDRLRSLSARISSMAIEVRGCGVFPSLHDPRVLWFGIDENPRLARLKQDIDQLFEQMDFPVDKKRFKPHLTFGRIKQITDRGKLGNLLKQYDGHFFLQKDAVGFTLFESRLTSSGPVYSVIEEFILSGSVSNETSPGKV